MTIRSDAYNCIFFQAKHSTKLTRYKELTTIAQKRKCVVDITKDDTNYKQMKLFDVSRGVSQQLFDSLMLEFITEGLLPFQFLELRAFNKTCCITATKFASDVSAYIKKSYERKSEN